MPQFMLALYSDPKSWGRMSPEEMQKATEKYMAWGRKPFVLKGHRLAGDPGRVLRKQNGKANAADGPYSETKEVLGGIYLIEAANYEEAVQRTLDNPQIEYGGSIEVRELFSM